MSDRRPKRRCVAAKAQQVVPSAIHYVGYVEDDETPEMIMKKFEELERIQKAAEVRRQQQQQHAVESQPQTVAGISNPDLRHSDVTIAGSTAPAEGTSGAAARSDDSAPQCPVGGLSDLQPVAYPAGQQPGSMVVESPNGDEPCAGAVMGDAEQTLLDEEALLEVFRQTSIFNVRSALLTNDAGEPLLGNTNWGAGTAPPYGVAYGMEDMLFVGGEPSDMDEEELQQTKDFWSDEDYELGGGSGHRSGSSRRRRAGGSNGRTSGQRSSSHDGDGPPREAKQVRASGPSGTSRHALNQVVMQYNRDTNALIRRRVTSGGGGGGGNGAGSGPGGGGLVQLRVPPPPLPLSWGRTVRPYQPPEPCPPPDEPKPSLAPETTPVGNAATTPTVASGGGDTAAISRGFESSDLVAFPFESALGGKQYIAVMVNAGWQPSDAADAFEQGCEVEVMRRFRGLPIPRLCPRGFVLVWAHKGLLQAVCRALASWGYVYVENLTWVHLTPANAIATSQHGRHFRRSHSTLLIFRREGEGRDIELRHQRNPDVVFDCIRTLPDGSGWDIPSEVLTTIETMLPGGKGAFLELWAPKGQRRPGWDHISEVQ
ncbi:hypothetical protein Vafri_13634 [Volvox africanus]|uniref:MT-A70 family protein n=1 Tax=Volvox africanus TaxID=51714 RepID=A0A8J4BD41_9CHLO|nr:hypothetical protein Vafri_13634 [Volvox africanus]